MAKVDEEALLNNNNNKKAYKHSKSWGAALCRSFFLLWQFGDGTMREAHGWMSE